jgi:hypothetical protein
MQCKLNLLLHVVALVRCSGSAGVTVELSALHTQQIQEVDVNNDTTTSSSTAVAVKRTTLASTEVLVIHIYIQCNVLQLYM